MGSTGGMGRLRSRVTVRVLASATVCLVLAGALAPVADAQAPPGGPPYGSTSTTRPPGGGNPTCTTSRNSGPPGSTGTATVRNVPVGEEVTITIGGEFAGSGVAGPSGNRDRTTVQITFVVPNLPPGRYDMVATGASFTRRCGSGQFRVEGGAAAAGSTETRASDGAGGPDRARRIAGVSLPESPAEWSVWLVVAAGLILLARGLLLGARHRWPDTNV